MSDYYRCTCGNHLEKVTQSANSMLNSEQFDAARMGDWFCRRCPKNEGKNRYFWDSEVAALAASPARIDCGEAGHSEGCCGNAQCLPSAAPAQPDTMKQSPHPEYDKGFSDGWNRCEARQAAAPAQPVAVPSPTEGMTIAQRILHVGGRNNAAGYVEFGSIQAVAALVQQVLRDLTPQPDAGVLEDAARMDWLGSVSEGCVRMDANGWCPSYIYWSPAHKEAGKNSAGNMTGPTLRAAIDAAIAAQQGDKT